MTDQTATLGVNGTNHSYPVMEGSVGPEVVDIRKLYAETGIFTYDPGFTSTGSCESKITYIDGDQGILLYRGYPIADLAEHGDFLSRLPARRASDGDHVRGRGRSVVLLSRQHGHQRSRAADDRIASADRQDADDRGDGLQIFDRPAVPLSGQQP